jgi:hypothetical protein
MTARAEPTLKLALAPTLEIGSSFGGSFGGERRASCHYD